MGPPLLPGLLALALPPAALLPGPPPQLAGLLPLVLGQLLPRVLPLVLLVPLTVPLGLPPLPHWRPLLPKGPPPQLAQQLPPLRGQLAWRQTLPLPLALPQVRPLLSPPLLLLPALRAPLQLAQRRLAAQVTGEPWGAPQSGFEACRLPLQLERPACCRRCHGRRLHCLHCRCCRAVAAVGHVAKRGAAAAVAVQGAAAAAAVQGAPSHVALAAPLAAAAEGWPHRRVPPPPALLPPAAAWQARWLLHLLRRAQQPAQQQQALWEPSWRAACQPGARQQSQGLRLQQLPPLRAWTCA